LPEKSSEAKTDKGKAFVFSLSRASRCHACDSKLLPGQLVKLEQAQDEKEALCSTCAKLDGLELVLKGNAKISRLATKFSTATFIVMKWSDMWKCYERIGILVSPEAVDQAEKESGEALKNRKRP
jgi:hypothetical protein